VNDLNQTPGMHPRTLFCAIVCGLFMAAMVGVALLLLESMS